MSIDLPARYRLGRGSVTHVNKTGTFVLCGNCIQTRSHFCDLSHPATATELRHVAVHNFCYHVTQMCAATPKNPFKSAGHKSEFQNLKSDRNMKNVLSVFGFLKIYLQYPPQIFKITTLLLLLLINYLKIIML